MQKLESKDGWIWIPHPAHLCVSEMCRFILATYVNGYIISTVGEYVPPEGVMRIFASIRNIKLDGIGEKLEQDYLNKIGFEEIGVDTFYETMVFNAKESEECIACPFVQADGNDLDCERYNDAKTAFIGHYKMCMKWNNKAKKENVS